MRPMIKYLYKIEQDERSGYDTFDSAVVCARSADEAKEIHPKQSWGDGTRTESTTSDWKTYTWASCPENVRVTKVGIADKSVKLNTVVCASFNPG